MRDAQSRAERKTVLRKMFEPMWRQAVDQVESELRAKGQYIDRGTMVDLMFGPFPQSLIDCAAQTTLTDWQQEDIELMKELAVELVEQIQKEALN